MIPTWPTYQNVVSKNKTEQKPTNQIYVLVVSVELHKFMEITKVQMYNFSMVEYTKQAFIKWERGTERGKPRTLCHLRAKLNFPALSKHISSSAIILRYWVSDLFSH